MYSNKAAVLMPVYNSEAYLKEAIESILNQTFSDFKFYIINDGSTDNSEQIIHGFNDSRIVYLKNETNRGLIYTLNRGLDVIDSDYILRMDADDIALPHRFEKQVRFMDEHPEVVVCGAQMHYFGDSDIITEFPQTDQSIRATMAFSNALNHPTVIIRTQVIKQNELRYDPQFEVIEDYEFWLRVGEYGKLANLSEVLLKYRWQGQNVTFKKIETRQTRYKSVYTKILERLQAEPNDHNLEMHLSLAYNSSEKPKVGEIRKYMINLKQINLKQGVFPKAEFEQCLNLLWKRLFYKVAKTGLKNVLRYWWLSGRITFSELRYYFGSLKPNQNASQK